MNTDLKLYVDTLISEFSRNGEPNRAAWQEAYLKNQFPFFGIESPKRRALQQPFLQKQYLPNKKELSDLIHALWQMPQRELQMFAMDLTDKYKSKFEETDIALLEYMITHKSWWDSVDFIATTLVGAYFKRFPHLKYTYVNKWIESGNMWLQRTAVIFQMKYKDELDTQLLTDAIKPLLGSKEFFINKAIGWMLRQYSKTDAQWVMNYVSNTPQLAGLSKREALRLIR